MGKLKQFFLGERLQQIDRELMIEQQINEQYDNYCKEREKWTEGEKNAENATIKEWEYLNKPRYERNTQN
tara:strand:+ start:4967 stop:5176 length:210 start_codon:yes stop_codon:yes gene_type:complete